MHTLMRETSKNFDFDILSVQSGDCVLPVGRIETDKRKVMKAMNPKTMFKLSYGLFVLTTRVDGKDNGCIINTAIQVASRIPLVSV